MKTKDKIEALREHMREENIEAFVVYSADPHMGEYLPSEWKEREWISGFTGSAGLVVITLNEAGLWTDSRYFVQAPIELKDSGIKLFKDGLSETPNYIEWITTQLSDNTTVCVNALCCPHNEWEKMKEAFATKNIKLSAAPLLEKVWTDREEAKEDRKIIVHPLCYTGRTVADKLQAIRKEMREKNADIHVVTSLDNIAWILNMRGNDVEFNPVFAGYLVIEKRAVTLFVDTKKCSSEVVAHLKEIEVEYFSYEFFFAFIKNFEEKTIWVNPASNQAIFKYIENKNTLIKLPPPSHLMKSTKNSTEISGAKIAHKRDGVAMVEFLYWLENNVGKTYITEVSVAEKLLSFRQQQKNFKGESFGTIAGYQGNGAIVHYSAKPDSCKEITNKGILLLDSGGQYLEGTTDITRTIPLEEPNDTFKTDYTLVLKGYINLSMAKFPHGTRGCNLDILARLPLWKADRNYGHGTGHGVGSFLNVHEGPLNIRQDLIDQAILPGMIMSNEPGLYRNNKYGIRLENLMVCVEDTKSEFGNFYKFETITLCPFYTSVIKKDLLNDTEIDWLNNYHTTVLKTLSPHIKNEEILKWLENMCKKI